MAANLNGPGFPWHTQTRIDRSVNRTRNLILAGFRPDSSLAWWATACSTARASPTASRTPRVSPKARTTTCWKTRKHARPTQPITVTEFFSYGCIHCKNFEPLIADYIETLPPDVEFRRVPVAFSPAWALLGQSYLALEAVNALEQNHDRIFRAVHDNTRGSSCPAR